MPRLSTTRTSMGDASGEDTKAHIQTPAMMHQFMKTTTPSTSQSYTSLQQKHSGQQDHHTEDRNASIQRVVDEQLFRELNASIPTEYEDDKPAATPGRSALEIIEKQAQKVLDARLAPSAASSKVAGKAENGSNVKDESVAGQGLVDGEEDYA